jgi:hypothetical protein
MSGFKKFGQNIYYNPCTLQIIDIRPLQFSKLKRIVNFGSKFYFFLFFGFSCERSERKLLESTAKEKKKLFTLIINTKKN